MAADLLTGGLDFAMAVLRKGWNAYPLMVRRTGGLTTAKQPTGLRDRWFALAGGRIAREDDGLGHQSRRLDLCHYTIRSLPLRF
jgi:hypothetical protein